MAAPPPSDATVQKKSRRPVLSSHAAHAHAFAALPPPGESKPPSSSYFPLPKPPAPLRSFALTQNGGSSGNAEGSTLYPTSVSSSRPADLARIINEENQRQGANRPWSSTPKDNTPPSSPKNLKSQSSPAAYRFEFATAAPFSAMTNTNAGSSGLSSSSGRSGRSALSIAEIDCIFVQGSRSSAYSARSHSSCSRPPSDGDSGPPALAELGIASSNEDLAEEIWTSDEAERERQRAERRAFMKARQSMREEARRRRRTGSGTEERSSQPTTTWREAIQAQAVIPLKDVPRPRDPTRVATAPQSPPAARETRHVPLDMLTTQSPPPSGPGPPDPPGQASALAAGCKALSLSPAHVAEQPSDQGSAPADGDTHQRRVGSILTKQK